MENLLFDFAEQNEEGEVIDLIEKEGVNINAKDDEGYNLLIKWLLYYRIYILTMSF